MAESRGRIRFALLAQSAIQHDSVFSMLGAGWTRLQTPLLPQIIGLTAVAQADDVPDGGLIVVDVLAPDGEKLATSETLVIVTPGPANVTALLIQLPIEIRDEGRYKVRFSGSVEDWQIDFTIGLVTSGRQ